MQAQVQKGDWLVFSEFQLRDAFQNNRAQKRLKYNQDINLKLELGYFYQDRWLLGFLGKLDHIEEEFNLLGDDVLSINRTFNIFSFLRYYFGKKDTKSPLFFHLSAGLENHRFKFKGNSQPQVIIQSWSWETYVGMGLGFFTKPDMSLHFLIDYDLMDWSFQEESNILKFDEGRIAFHISWQAKIGGRKRANLKKLAFSGFSKNTKAVQINLGFFPQSNNTALMDIDFGWMIFPKKNWAVGLFAPINLSFSRAPFQRAIFETALFSRYYISISPEIQIFPHLQGSVSGELNYVPNQGSQNDFEYRLIQSNLNVGFGMNYFLNQHISVEWTFGRNFQKIKNETLTGKGIFLDSKLNYFF